MYPFKDCTSYLRMCHTIPSLLYSFKRNRSSTLAYFDGYKANKKPPAGASELPRAALLDMGLHSSFQSVLLGKFACRVSSLIRIWRGQTDSEASAVDLEGQPALFVIVGLPHRSGYSAVYCIRRFLSAVLCV